MSRRTFLCFLKTTELMIEEGNIYSLQYATMHDTKWCSLSQPEQERQLNS